MSRPADEALFDPGLQPERTALAWRRTAATMAVGSLVGMRVLAHSAGYVALVGCLAALLLCGYVAIRAHRRYQRVTRALMTGDGVRLPTDGRGPLAMAVAATVLALAAVVVLLSG